MLTSILKWFKRKPKPWGGYETRWEYLSSKINVDLVSDLTVKNAVDLLNRVGENEPFAVEIEHYGNLQRGIMLFWYNPYCIHGLQVVIESDRYEIYDADKFGIYVPSGKYSDLVLTQEFTPLYQRICELKHLCKSLGV